MEKQDTVFGFLDEVKKAGLNEEQVYKQIHSYIEYKAKQTMIPSFGHFELTPLCNLNCKMCYVHLSEAQMQNHRLLPAETWISLMKQAVKAGMISANLSGGECLTYPRLEEIFLYLESVGVETSILTNGVLLNHERISFFKEHPPEFIQVSLYGNSEDAYERVTGKRVFSKVLENICSAKEANLNLRLSITPNRFMMEDISDTICLAKGLDLPYVISSSLLTPRSSTGRDKTAFDISVDETIKILSFVRLIENRELYHQEVVPYIEGKETKFEYSGLKCGAGRNTFSIRWNGNMHPCTQLESVVAEPIKVGFDSAWKHINREVSTYPAFVKCKDCLYSDSCDFCAAENEKMGSKECLNSFWCKRTWKMVESGLKQVKKE